MDKTLKYILLGVGAFFILGKMNKGNTSIINPAGNGGGDNTGNLTAFLRTIQWAEGTSKRANPYAVCYGYSHTIQNYNEHPAITGEWTGETLPASYCYAANVSYPCKSTAAGAYQINKPTWEWMRNKYALNDFTPESQDLAAIGLIRTKNALNDIENGRIVQAVYKLNSIWASFPNANYSQPERDIDTLLTVYQNYGGNIA